MTVKQKWLLERLLIPTGIIPPFVTYDDLKYNEQSRKKIGNIGYEYFYILEQDSEKIKKSVIGGKTFALHVPWHGFPFIERLPQPLRGILNYIVLGEKRFPNDHIIKIRKSLEFAAQIGAKVITTHIIFFDHQHIPEELAQIAELEEKFQIKVAVEHEGNYLDLYQQKWGFSFKKVDGSYEWMTNPIKLIDTLKKFYPRKNFGLCLDTAALRNFNLPIIETVTPIYKNIIHYHLADNPVGGDDFALEINNPEIASLVSFLYEKKYSGLITAEIGATNNDFKEELIGKIYGATSLIGFPVFKGTCIKNAQRHIQNSCNYLLKNI